MPPVFTSLLAQRLQEEAKRPCAEATDGLVVRDGWSYVAPGGYHLLVQVRAGVPTICLDPRAPEHFSRPAADPMLRSLAAVYRDGLVAVVPTGMGEDGRPGCARVRALGGQVIVQDEATSVVWGMPGAVVKAGHASWVVPLPRIAGLVTALATTSKAAV